jgi:transcriptional regulator of acetoin/glycerol metabolism
MDRREDIPLLAQYFAQRVGGTRTIVITSDARRALLSYDWPDNARELRQTIECALALGDGLRVDAIGVRAALGDRLASKPLASNGEIALDRQRLVYLLEACDWDTAAAGRQIGVNRSTIYRRMWRFGITPPTAEDLRDLHGSSAHLRAPHANGAKRGTRGTR